MNISRLRLIVLALGCTSVLAGQPLDDTQLNHVIDPQSADLIHQVTS